VCGGGRGVGCMCRGSGVVRRVCRGGREVGHGCRGGREIRRVCGGRWVDRLWVWGD
jgi:hypothetical protein